MPKGIFITAKDLQTVEGITNRYAQKLLTKISKQLRKQPGQKVSMLEYATYRGVTVDEVKRELKVA